MVGTHTRSGLHPFQILKQRNPKGGGGLLHVTLHPAAMAAKFQSASPLRLPDWHRRANVAVAGLKSSSMPSRSRACARETYSLFGSQKPVKQLIKEGFNSLFVVVGGLEG